GVLLEIDGNKVLVRADTQAGRVYIAVFGPPAGRRQALAVIRAELTAIHRTVPGLEAKPMVPLPHDPGKVEDYRHLLRLEAKRVGEYLPVDAKQTYRVRELLDGIEEPEQRQARAVVIMGDNYEIYGQAAAVGRNARAQGNTFQQVVQEAASDLDLSQLAKELAQLRGTLLQEASEGDDYRALAAVT
ncbi:MAG: hypothetical protein GY824_03990, partial [Delftia sp.]|nr:hypothetical protein [Delftia sp.]